MFHLSFDREFQDEQEYVFLEFFWDLLPFEKSKKLEESKKARLFAYFSKMEFSKFYTNLDYLN